MVLAPDTGRTILGIRRGIVLSGANVVPTLNTTSRNLILPTPPILSSLCPERDLTRHRRSLSVRRLNREAGPNQVCPVLHQVQANARV